MKKICSVIVLSLLFFHSQSQDFLGISTGNFAGVSSVMLQPASIVDSRYKFDINLFSTSINYSNNYFLVNRNAILKFNKNSFSDYRTFKENYLSEASLSGGERVFLNINNRTQMPLSFMATTGKKSAIAFNIQSRSMIQGRGITQELAKMAYNGFYSPALNNSTIDASGFNLKALNWAEIGFTYGRVLYASDKHFFKAAITGKYLAGVASINMGSNDIRFSVNNDSSINFNTNRFDYNHNRNADFDMVFDKNFSPDANAVGFDAGIVYEYRGNFKKFKYIRNDDEKSYVEDRRDVNKYIYKLGVSLIDVGMFRFQKPDNVNSFNANITNWNVASANYNTIREFDTALANRVVSIPGSRFFNAYLPAALSVQFDLRFIKGFYLNAMAYRPVTIGKDAGQRFNSYGFYTITPRWESRHIGIYIPYTILDKNSLTNYQQNQLGATVRLGPLFIGSSNLGTMLFNENLKAADIHVGLKIGITYGKPNKSSTYVQKLFSKNTDTPLPLITNSTTVVKDTVLIQINKSSRLFIDYNKGKVYDNPNLKGNIIIVNNYYYGNTPATSVIKSDSLPKQVIMAQYYEQLIQQNDSMISLRNKAVINQHKKKIADSINLKKQELDSLIHEMQILRIQIDSAIAKDSLDVSILPTNNRSLENKSNNVENLRQSVDSFLSKKFTKPFADSVALNLIADSLARNNTSIKKKSVDNNKEVAIVNKSVTDKRSVVSVLKAQQNDLKIPIVTNSSDDQNKRQSLLDKQDQIINKFRNENSIIKNDIARLQASAAENNQNYQEDNPLIPRLSPPAKNETIFNTVPILRDTIYIRDTIKQSDTVTITKSDTVRLLVAKPSAEKDTTNAAKAPVTILRDTIIKQASFDYTTMPETVLLFGIGNSAVQQVYNKRLDFIAGVLVNDKNLQVAVTGHSDKSGSPEINRALSLKRAQNTSSFLLSKGVPNEQIKIRAVSYLEPAMKGNTKNANSQNRRVVIKLMQRE